MAGGAGRTYGMCSGRWRWAHLPNAVAGGAGRTYRMRSGRWHWAHLRNAQWQVVLGALTKCSGKWRWTEHRAVITRVEHGEQDTEGVLGVWLQVVDGVCVLGLIRHRGDHRHVLPHVGSCLTCRCMHAQV